MAEEHPDRGINKVSPGTFMPGTLYGNSPQPERNLKVTRHLIAFVHYEQGNKDYDAAPMECVCGWSGVSKDWNAHRGAKWSTQKGVKADG